MHDPKYNWKYYSEPEPYLNNRRIFCPRGKMIGGCSSHNGMVFVRGNPLDFERWASYGLPNWSYKNVLPYFKKLETWSGGENLYRGGKGPLKVNRSKIDERFPLFNSLIKAAAEAGYETFEDSNGFKQDGFGTFDVTIDGGKRQSVARAYLEEVKNFKNLIVFFAFTVFISSYSFKVHADDDNTNVYKQLNMFGEVYERVRREYVEEVSDKELIEAAIEGMLQSLDPHSSFMNEDTFKDMQVQTKGEFGGLGIEVSMEDGFVKVVSPIDDTPAFEAGVQAGDFIIEIDGVSVYGMTLGDAVDKMRGKVNTEITIKISRGELEPFDIVIVRDKIKVQSVRARREGNAAYLRITSFNEKTESGLIKNMNKLTEEIGKDITGVILDLRNNPGGLLNQAVAVSDAFLERGEIVSTRGRKKRGQQKFNAIKGDISNGLPIVVLINGGSASASEIVAGALQDHKRAIIMGTTSFGKGSVQTIIPVQRDSAMRLTTAKYYTPSGNSIQATGITPDIIVKQANIEELESFSNRKESDLKGHLENPTEGNKTLDEIKEKQNTSNLDDSNKKIDYQLNRALDLLEGIALYNKNA